MNTMDIIPETLCKSVDLNDLRFCFRQRERRTNKGDYGQILCVCGSFPESKTLGLAMSGAATLSAKAALRTGAGLARVFTHKENFSAVSSALPEAVMLLYEESLDYELLASEVKRADAVLVGCGLGKSQMSREIVEIVLKNISSPLVIDADGLNIISGNPQFWDYMSAEQRKQTVITPHPKEMSRLCGRSVNEILERPVQSAEEFSQKYGVITLLKDHNTVITNGETVYINNSGNAGMATAGSGDVLGGILVSMLGNSTLEARSILHKVAIGAYLHGLSGDFAAELYGEHCMIAGDIVDCICDAVASVIK